MRKVAGFAIILLCFLIAHTAKGSEKSIGAIFYTHAEGFEEGFSTDFDWGWNKTYGGTESDYALVLVQTVDGGYALAGSTYSFGAGSSDMWLVKTAADGGHEWNKTYGGIGGDHALDLIQTVDGGYALAGSTYSYGVRRDAWLVKVDASGNHVWNKTYGGTGEDRAYALVETADGGYALVGASDSWGAGAHDFWIVKTDSGGNHVWNKTYGGTGEDFAYALVETTDEGYALTGTTYSFGAGNGDAWLVKTDETGVIPEFLSMAFLSAFMVLVALVMILVRRIQHVSHINFPAQKESPQFEVIGFADVVRLEDYVRFIKLTSAK